MSKLWIFGDSFSETFKQGEIFLWIEFNSNMPVSIEYNINFE